MGIYNSFLRVEFSQSKGMKLFDSWSILPFCQNTFQSVWFTLTSTTTERLFSPVFVVYINEITRCVLFWVRFLFHNTCLWDSFILLHTVADCFFLLLLEFHCVTIPQFIYPLMSIWAFSHSALLWVVLLWRVFWRIRVHFSVFSYLEVELLSIHILNFNR